jgi:hypothetical protein
VRGSGSRVKIELRCLLPKKMTRCVVKIVQEDSKLCNRCDCIVICNSYTLYSISVCIQLLKRQHLRDEVRQTCQGFFTSVSKAVESVVKHTGSQPHSEEMVSMVMPPLVYAYSEIWTRKCRDMGEGEIDVKSTINFQFVLRWSLSALNGQVSLK